ncbi:MAG: hypothetical protein ACP5E5_14125 [Acidobacteriaceae bacterium]
MGNLLPSLAAIFSRRRACGLALCLATTPLLLGASLLSADLSSASAQVLAQRNWTGSGVTVQTWWQRGVFYRIDPRRFQDSTGNGQGDLAGITQRLDYLQSLGVDALIIETAPQAAHAASARQPLLQPAAQTPPTPASQPLEPTPEVSAVFDTLVREAIGRHLRVLLELGAPASQSADAPYLASARAWLSQGAAGIYIPTPALQQVDGPEHVAVLIDQLHTLTASFPGERVLLADPPAPARPDDDPVVAVALAQDVQLIAGTPLGTAPDLPDGDLSNDPTGDPTSATATIPSAAALRAAWIADLTPHPNRRSADAASTAPAPKQGRPTQRPSRPQTHTTPNQTGEDQSPDHIILSAAGNPLLFAARVPPISTPDRRLALQRALAMMLLASRSAVLLDYGQELGLEPSSAGAPLMQWTPTNLTRKPPPRPTPPPPPPAPANGYATFLPYVPPLPRDLFPPPPMPDVEESDQPPPVDPALLPGFTKGDLNPALQSPNGGIANVALESSDPGSLLNLYRQLIALHHDNAALRDGTQEILDYDALDALVWVRRSPPGSPTSNTVVAACNLSTRPLVLSRDLGAVTVNIMRSVLRPEPPNLLKIDPGHVMLGQTR